MRHTVAIKLEANITHTIFADLAPGIIIVIIQRKYLFFQDFIQFIQIIFILFLHIHLAIIGFGNNKTIISMIDKFRDPSIIS